jgi:hypothetical protein
MPLMWICLKHPWCYMWITESTEIIKAHPRIKSCLQRLAVKISVKFWHDPHLTGVALGSDPLIFSSIDGKRHGKTMEYWRGETHKCATEWIKYMNMAIHSCQKHKSPIITELYNICIRCFSPNRKDVKRTLKEFKFHQIMVIYKFNNIDKPNNPMLLHINTNPFIFASIKHSDVSSRSNSKDEPLFIVWCSRPSLYT